MEELEIHQKNKGGRPQKEVKRTFILSVKCSADERKIITGKAKICGLNLSQYLREMGLNGKIDNYKKVLPKEVLNLTGTFSHMAANLNQIARKRNGIDELNALERITLQEQSQQLKALAAEVKNYLK